MQYRIKITAKARKNLSKIPTKHQEQIQKKLEQLAKDSSSITSKKFKGVEALYYRIKSGDYRIVYEIENDKLIIVVVRIGHRKNVYDGLQ